MRFDPAASDKQMLIAFLPIVIVYGMFFYGSSTLPPSAIRMEMDAIARGVVPPAGFSGKPDCFTVAKGWGVACEYVGPAEAAPDLRALSPSLLARGWRYAGKTTEDRVVLCKRDVYVDLEAPPPSGQTRVLRVRAVVRPSPASTARDQFACDGMKPA